MVTKKKDLYFTRDAKFFLINGFTIKNKYYDI